MSEVLIVGAGPVGLTAAAELSRYGINVRIIDKSPKPTDTSKALVVWSRTLELMDRMECTAAFLGAGLRCHGASMRSGGSILERTSFDDIASPYNFALMIPQRDTERLLAEQLQSFGIAVERQVELIGLTEATNEVEAQLRHADGSVERVRAPWLIGCGGAHSTVRHELDIEFKGSTQGDDWLLADVRLEGDRAPPRDEIVTFLHRDGPFTVFPMPEGRARIAGVIGKADPVHPRPDPTLADCQAMVDLRTGGGFQVTDPIWLANFRINERKVAGYRRGRIFLAGDAAHIHSPSGGQGMNTGMQDAVNLAWKLALVVKGHANEALLDSYSSERTAVANMVLRNATRLTDLAALTNPAAQAARNLALRVLFGFHGVRERMATTMSEIGITYAGSPLSTGLLGGTRLAPEDYAGLPPGAGSDPRFVLYTADGKKGTALAAQFPSLLEPQPRKPDDPDSLFLARPDGYIGFSSGPSAWDEAEHYLQRLI
jgi:2-polyprenyl-6-methoxyphenol hydroxylase-like FAD-dependent oxidoreductase